MKKTAIAALLLFGFSAPVLGTGYAELNVGIDYYNQERYADAITWFDKALAGTLTNDQKHIALYDRGSAKLAAGDAQKAVEDLTAALVIAPQDDVAREERAFAYIAAGDKDKALADADAIQNKKPDDLQANIQRGMLNWVLERYPQAAEAFSKPAEAGYPYGWLWQQLANIRQGRGVTPFHGISVGLAGLHRKVTSGYGWPDTVVAFYSGGRSEDEVMKAVKEAGENEANLCEANFYLAEWHLVHGDNAGARPLLTHAASDCPRDFMESRMARHELGNLR